MSTTDPDPRDQPSPLPELNYNIAPSTPPDERIEALKLIADSIAQQRQLASQAMILHPTSLAFSVAILAVLYRLLDFYTFITTSAGMVMIALLAVRWYTAAYIPMAEAIGFKWLEDTTRVRSNSNGHSPTNSVSGATSKNANANVNGNGGGGGNNRDPIVLVAKWGDETIGALVLRVIKRVGRGLLEEGAKIVWGKGGRGMAFEEEHANSGRVLPEWFDGGFEREEEKGREMLRAVVEEVRRERSSR
ncbi:uncharacterized protein KY384_007588 [Bacidia gigantensis]|uniref:uncharacterized protein n=1 Tax=Bacidia gigantensis TaxID=2732470 RepID=UPI001D05020A|nr:uncharacterized protein KY384_007588 [Bacidia gigantensis]KAG8527436.1 hypothetical protein KY384_007588 [Bacidia gigantensis]